MNLRTIQQKNAAIEFLIRPVWISPSSVISPASITAAGSMTSLTPRCSSTITSNHSSVTWSQHHSRGISRPDRPPAAKGWAGTDVHHDQCGPKPAARLETAGGESRSNSPRGHRLNDREACQPLQARPRPQDATSPAPGRKRGGEDCVPHAELLHAPSAITEPPHGVRRRVVIDPEVLSDRVERRATSAHLGRLGGDPLVHRGLGRIPQLKGEDVVEQGSKALRTRPPLQPLKIDDLQDVKHTKLVSLLRKGCSAEFLPEAAGRARVSGRDVAFAGWQ